MSDDYLFQSLQMHQITGLKLIHWVVLKVEMGERREAGDGVRDGRDGGGSDFQMG